MRAVRQRVAVHVEGHRHQVVITHRRDQIDDAPFAQQIQRRLERSVAHATAVPELGAEVIDDGLMPGEREQGYTLTCVGKARGRVVLEA